MATTTTSDNPHPIPLTESDVLVRGFLAANPDLDASLGPVQVMTDRYTNEEWEAQIQETVRAVLAEVESGSRAKKVYPGPRMRDGEKALRELSKTIDHTALKLDATSTVIDGLCSEARTEGFKSVCVRLPWVQRCVSNLKGSDVLVACVVGFHEGTQDTLHKLREARAAVQAGATELDIVLNHTLLTQHTSPPPSSSSSSASSNTHSHRSKTSTDTITALPNRDSAIDDITAANTLLNTNSTSSSPPPSTTSTSTTTTSNNTLQTDYSLLYRELASLRSLCPSPVTLKLILETSQLTHPQILAAAHLAAAASFDFIKTSTGFNGHGATLPHVQLMVAAAESLAKRGVGSRKLQVKASGGVRDLDTAVQMLEAGATRLGTSSGLWIMQEARRKAGEGRRMGSGGGMETDEDEDRPGGGVTRLYTDDSSY
ncbi:similar to deoxyribose-phosphate aldolase [Plenodomus lingam JN3]|uniref:deoxyribose-phosphate aldolase n=1 Tax=Leptosphaeria maculans (strain JN3 / isolate v23.1.3 / race Av1-4-5-6-7-8) TaxID=985895 RepID=E4ZTD2_LEPMJ|nr:similar to deoxyribose-phosphate aldolase [Plenodomus lingam JN3]CBX94788.1 similar to deoxyribose-phosphate aldolase [Plenodomus lingam JN3]